MRILLFIIGVGCIFFSVKVLLKEKISIGKPLFKKKVRIEDICDIWMSDSSGCDTPGDSSKQPPVKEQPVASGPLSPSTNPDQTSAITQAQTKILYRHTEAQEFYDRHVAGKTYFGGTAGEVVREVLRILDEGGDCPSVVQKFKDPDATYPKDTFDIHARVTLLVHSLAVAETMIRQAGNQLAVIPKSVIAALGHDLGKMIGQQNPLYSMGDHPLIGITMLDQIEAFKKLSYREDIIRAIKDHHMPGQKDLFGAMLMKADQETRRNEITEFMKKSEQKIKEVAVENKGQVPAEDLPIFPVLGNPQAPAEQKEVGKETNTGEVAKDLPAFPVLGTQVTTVNNAAGPRPQVDHYGAGAEQPQYQKPGEILLPWFNADEFLKELKPYINRLNGTRFEAFSMPGGIVYVQVKVLEDIAKKLGRRQRDPDVMRMDANRDLKHSIIYSIVCMLRREKDAIARGLIKDDYFGGPFVMKMKNGRSIDKAFFTPFRADVFAERVSDLEDLKVGRLMEIESVTPKYESSGVT